MTHGDAFNDMPEEYREYKQLVAVAYKDKSETDKAIDDGKPRWIYHVDIGWQHVIFAGKNYNHLKPLLIYQKVTEGVQRIGDETDNPFMLIQTGVEILPYGETPPPAVSEKPKAIASLRFEHEGGVWEHMAENISIEDRPYEGYGPKGNWIYVASRNFSFTFRGSPRLGLLPYMPGSGRLKIVMLITGTIYEGEATVDGRDDNLGGDCPYTEFIAFRMRRDEKPQYTPDPLPDGIPSLNRCPDCDNTLEQRSMPDGIEEWCSECNMKVIKSEEERHQKVINWQSHDWARRQVDMDKNWDEVWLICLQCGLHSRPGNTEVQSCSFYTDADREIWGGTELAEDRLDHLIKAAEGVCDLPVPEGKPALNLAVVTLQVALEEYQGIDKEPTVAEGPMHPDMIRAELQKAMDEGYQVCMLLKAGYSHTESSGIKVSSLSGRILEVGEETLCIKAIFREYDSDEICDILTIHSVKRMGSGNGDAPTGPTKSELETIQKYSDGLYLITADKGYVVKIYRAIDTGDPDKIEFRDHREELVSLRLCDILEYGEAKIGLGSWWMLMESKLENGIGE